VPRVLTHTLAYVANPKPALAPQRASHTALTVVFCGGADVQWPRRWRCITPPPPHTPLPHDDNEVAAPLLLPGCLPPPSPCLHSTVRGVCPCAFCSCVAGTHTPSGVGRVGSTLRGVEWMQAGTVEHSAPTWERISSATGGVKARPASEWHLGEGVRARGRSYLPLHAEPSEGTLAARPPQMFSAMPRR
jgi:hypothetical protein